MWNAVHLGLHWNGDLLLNLFSGTPRPLRDDSHVVICDIGICLNRQIVKGHRSPENQQDAKRNDDEAIIQGKIDQCSNHESPLAPCRYWLSIAFCKANGFTTTFWPGCSPDLSSCMPFGNVSPAITSTRWNLFPGAGM